MPFSIGTPHESKASLGFIALGLDAYGPVSGNWCWIRADELRLRYALTHGWRIAIFLATIVIYTLIYIKLRRLFGTLKLALQSPSGGSDRRSTRPESEADTLEQSDTQRIWVTTTVSTSYEMENQQQSKGINDGSNRDIEHGQQASPATKLSQQPSRGTDPARQAPASPNLRRMLLLNGYPIAYILFWIPGIANRLVESVGTSPQWLTSLQACTQFIGLANALTYGFTEQLQRAVKMWISTRGFRTLGN